jgi:branched-chain amino acid transport system substrate-binding protein
MDKTTKSIVGVIIALVVIGGAYAIFRNKDNSGNSDTKPDTAMVSSGETIKVGWLGPLTGDGGKIGENAKAATEIAVDEVNAEGGINGKKLELIYEDGKCTGKDASNAANKLINVDKVSVILGGACSGETSAFAGIAEQAKVTTISYCSSAPTISNAGDYIFRVYPSDTFQGSFAADYVYNTLGKRKVAVLYVKTDYGSGVDKVFVEKFKQLGGQILSDEGYEQTARDFRTQISKIKASGPDLVYFIGYTEASVPFLKQASDQKLGVTLYGADAWDDTKLFEQAGAAGEGVMYTVAAPSKSQSFKDKMKAKLGTEEVIACSAPAYDAVKLLKQVMEKVGTDSTAIKNELYKTTYTGGVSAESLSFDKNGDITKADYVIKTVKNGKAQ